MSMTGMGLSAMSGRRRLAVPRSPLRVAGSCSRVRVAGMIDMGVASVRHMQMRAVGGTTDPAKDRKEGDCQRPSKESGDEHFVHVDAPPFARWPQ